MSFIGFSFLSGSKKIRTMKEIALGIIKAKKTMDAASANLVAFLKTKRERRSIKWRDGSVFIKVFYSTSTCRQPQTSLSYLQLKHSLCFDQLVSFYTSGTNEKNCLVVFGFVCLKSYFLHTTKSGEFIILHKALGGLIMYIYYVEELFKGVITKVDRWPLLPTFVL